MRLLTGGAFPLVDQTADIANSFHAYGQRRDEPRIDYILTRGFRSPGPAGAWDETLHGLPLSDHDALYTTLETEE